MFMGTLQVQYLKKIVGSVLSTFSDIVTTGERTEINIKNGKLPSVDGASSGENKPYSNFYKKGRGG